MLLLLLMMMTKYENFHFVESPRSTPSPAEINSSPDLSPNASSNATELDMGRVHPRSGRVGLGQVGSGPDFSLFSGLGRVGSICVGLCESPWIIQNVTLSVIVKFTQFSELLVLLKLFSV